MADWQHLARLVVARRTELGYTNRDDFAADTGFKARTLGDLETGRKQSYYSATLARAERALRWAAGSIDAILEGGTPTPLDDNSAPALEQPGPAYGVTRPDLSERDEAVMKVLNSGLPKEKIEQIIRMLVAEKQAADRARAEHADNLIHLLRDAH